MYAPTEALASRLLLRCTDRLIEWCLGHPVGRVARHAVHAKTDRCLLALLYRFYVPLRFSAV
jgi:hypothetical protein